MSNTVTYVSILQHTTDYSSCYDTICTDKAKLNENSILFLFQKNLPKSYASSSPVAAASRFLDVGGGAFAANLRARGGGGGFVPAGAFALDLLEGGADGRERVWSFDRVDLVVAFTVIAKVTFFRGRVGPDCDFDDGSELGGGGRLRFSAEEECGTSSSSASSSSSFSTSSALATPSSTSSASSSESPLSAPDPISSASASDLSSTSESLPLSVLNHGVSSARARSSIRSEDNRTRSRDRRISLRGGNFSKSAASSSYIVISAEDSASASAVVLEPEIIGGTAYRESLPVDQSRKTMRAAAARSSLPP